MPDFTQGPLPNDGAVVSKATDLENWISNTTVYNLDANAFKGGTLQFVYSQSEPPATNTRFAGMLWFKRGEGRLYIYDNPYMPSQTGASNAAANWLSLSDRRDVFFRNIEIVQPGEPMQLEMQNSNSEYWTPTNGAIYNDPARPLDPTWRNHLFLTKATGAKKRTGYNEPNCGTPLWFVALDSGDSGAMTRFVEFGFCNILMNTGTTGVAVECGVREESGFTGVRGFDAVSYYWSVYTGQSNVARAAKHNFVAIALDSSATNPSVMWSRPAYKRPFAPFSVDG